MALDQLRGRKRIQPRERRLVEAPISRKKSVRNLHCVRCYKEVRQDARPFAATAKMIHKEFTCLKRSALIKI